MKKVKLQNRTLQFQEEIHNEKIQPYRTINHFLLF